MVDSAFWHELRKDFEGLQPAQFGLMWSSHPQVSLAGELLQSKWSWWPSSDESLRARLSAMALRGARALGHKSEDAWYDELRKADFADFELTGRSIQKQPDGSMLESRTGRLDDVVKQSITLCHRLEAAGVSEAEPVPQAVEAAVSPALGDLPKPQRKRGPSPDYETATRVAALVAKVAPEAPWGSKLDEICAELDDEAVPRPKTWNRKGYKDWCDCLVGERQLVVKAISHHLNLAARAPKT